MKYLVLFVLIYSLVQCISIAKRHMQADSKGEEFVMSFIDIIIYGSCVVWFFVEHFNDIY